MDDLKDELKYCYRVDRFTVHDPRAEKAEIEKIEEYLLVAGEHSVIKVKDVEYGYCTVQTHGIIFNITLDPYLQNEEDVIELIDKLQKMVMVYDYVISELKKMSKKDAARSPLFELKTKIEEDLENGELNTKYLAYLDKKTIRDLQARCEYLTHAYELEWRGVISVETLKKFCAIEDLDAYVEGNDLLHNPEGEDKQVKFYGIGEFSDGYSLLDHFRPANIDELARYQDIPKTLKEEKLCKLAERQFYQQMSKAFKLYSKGEKLANDLNNAKTRLGKRFVEAKMRKVGEKFNEESAHIAFIKQFE